MGKNSSIMRSVGVSFLIVSLFLSGCSTRYLKKEIFGSTPADFEDMKKIYEKTFAVTPNDCFKRSMGLLEEIGAHTPVADKERYFIVAVRFETFFRGCIDTTEVAILMTVDGQGKTLVQVVSYNTDLAGAVADNLFKRIEDPEWKRPPVKLPPLVTL